MHTTKVSVCALKQKSALLTSVGDRVMRLSRPQRLHDCALMLGVCTLGDKWTKGSTLCSR